MLIFLPVLNVSSDFNHKISGFKLSVRRHLVGQLEQQCQKPEASAAQWHRMYAVQHKPHKPFRVLLCAQAELNTN